ncbi:MAG: hypothetical protein J4473_00185 [Candidatus Aenigmarchaeota archaeon]|nr:hypothetical protein [Candidatus Aenigmarchaeota archaeon]
MVLQHYYETAKRWLQRTPDEVSSGDGDIEPDEISGFGTGTEYCQVCKRQILGIFLKTSAFNGQTYHKKHPIHRLRIGVYRENMA